MVTFCNRSNTPSRLCRTPSINRGRVLGHKGRKGREILRFAQYDIKNAGRDICLDIPCPETNTIYRSAFYYIIKFLGNVIDDARVLSYHQFTPRGMV